MSFENSNMSYVHLVSYPSTWLPDVSTARVLVVGALEQNLQELTELLQSTWPQQSWALYHVPDFDITAQSHVDWLLVNAAHCHTCMGWGTDAVNLLLCTLLHAKVIKGTVPEQLAKLYHVSKLPQHHIHDVVVELFNSLHKET